MNCVTHFCFVFINLLKWIRYLIYREMNCIHNWKYSFTNAIIIFHVFTFSHALKCLVGDNDPLLHVGKVDYGNGTVIGQKPNYFKNVECPGYTYLCVSIEAGKYNLKTKEFYLYNFLGKIT